jgi:hypothetical protein
VLLLRCGVLRGDGESVADRRGYAVTAELGRGAQRVRNGGTRGRPIVGRTEAAARRSSNLPRPVGWDPG